MKKVKKIIALMLAVMMSVSVLTVGSVINADDMEVPYSLDFYWKTAAKNVVSKINPGFAPYDNNAYFEGNVNGLQAMDMTEMFGGDFAYYPLTLVMSKFTTDIVYSSITVQPKIKNFTDGTVGYPSAIGYVFTTHSEEYDAPEKTFDGVYDPDDYFFGFHGAQAKGEGDGEYTLTLTLTDDVSAGSEYAEYACGAGGEAGEGYYEKLCWTVVNNDKLVSYGGATLDTPIAAGDAYTLQLCRDYDDSAEKFIFVVYIPETDEYVDLGDAVDHIAVDKQYYIGVEAYGYGVNQHNSTFDVVDINGINAANYYGDYTHICDYIAGNDSCSEYEFCIFCEKKINVVYTHSNVSTEWMTDGKAHWHKCDGDDCNLETVEDYLAAFEADEALKTTLSYTETCDYDEGKGILMGRQGKIIDTEVSTTVGRTIFGLTEAQLGEIGNNLVIVGSDGEKQVEITVDCAYTYFYDGDQKIEAGKDGLEDIAAFVIIDNDGTTNDDNTINGYGYYRLYSDSTENFLSDALYIAPIN